ncbi:TIGR04255 family protein [Thiocapsa imhoffii]|uniref:TIGR04255 family protein n=1 Tax=Thiocapsa imhoffii TaxID=382777 RepID=UPI001902C7E4
MTADETPLTGPPPAEVPLSDAPLVRVIAQVRFPLVASVEKRDFMAPFQEAIRAEYPVLRPEQNRSIIFGQQGVMDSSDNTIWRFHDARGVWRVTLAPDFLALETGLYTNRDDFLDRLNRVLEALVAYVDPKVIDRLGVRYIDRVTGKHLGDLPRLVRPEVCGVLSTPLASHARHSISETVFVLPDNAGQVLTRWGLVPAQGTVDPAAVDAIDEPSWLLDIDAFQTETRALDVEAAVQQARGFAERIYSVFRWAVTDEFLRRYGGQP